MPSLTWEEKIRTRFTSKLEICHKIHTENVNFFFSFVTKVFHQNENTLDSVWRNTN